MNIEEVKEDYETIRNVNEELLNVVRNYPLNVQKKKKKKKKKKKISELTGVLRSIEDKYAKFMKDLGVCSECHYEYGTTYTLDDVLLFVSSLESKD